MGEMENKSYMSLTEGDPKAVDLGLGVLWADRNVDSSLPVSFGGYYSWGDLYPWKSEYNYYFSVPHGQRISLRQMTRNVISGNPSFDVAAKKCKNGWRMPTVAEFKELIDKCQWTWIGEEENGEAVSGGYEIRGMNGSCIFLPAAGIGHGDVPEESFIEDCAEYGFYWSGNICENDADLAYALCFHKERHILQQEWRSRGCSIRPVCSRT